MGHAQHDLFDAKLATAFDDLFQSRHDRLRPVEAKALCAGVLHLAELLELLCLDELIEDRAPSLGSESDVLALALDAMLDPILLRGNRDVHVLHADVPTVGAAHYPQDLPHRCRFQAQHPVDKNGAVEVGLREAVSLRLQFAVHLAVRQPQRVEISGEVAHDAVGTDQHQRADRILCRPQRSGRRHLKTDGLRP